jgi:pimeloyl-ACP methyl ester carboxylesterase
MNDCRITSFHPEPAMRTTATCCAAASLIGVASACFTVAAAHSPSSSYEYKTKVHYEAGNQVIAPRSTPDPKQADFALWLPANVERISALIAISRHGSGESFFRNQQIRALATELNLALVGFIGDGVQRGVAPGVLENALVQLAAQSHHEEIKHSPIVTFGMSNGTGFSCGYACMQPERVIAWIAYHPGSDLLFSRQFDPKVVADAIAHDAENQWLDQSPPPLYAIPGLVMLGEVDELAALSKGSPEKPAGNCQLAVERARRQHNALMQLIVEPGLGHGHRGDASWGIVIEFIRTMVELRVPMTTDNNKERPRLNVVNIDDGWLGMNWNAAIGGGQQLAILPCTKFNGDRGVTSWLPTEQYARHWQDFSKNGALRSKHR